MAKKNLSYEERMDEIFNKGSLWTHRSLRTIFDPFSSEYSNTTMQEKMEILHKILVKGEELDVLIRDYKNRYLESGRNDIAQATEKSFKFMLEYILRQKEN